MSSRRILLLVIILLASTGLTGSLFAQESPNAPQTFAQPLYAGCYLAAENVCRIHVEPFEVQVNESAGERAAEFRLFANNVNDSAASFELYNFHTSSSYSFKPQNDYSPTLVTQDFYAQCGETYTINVLTRGDYRNRRRLVWQRGRHRRI